MRLAAILAFALAAPAAAQPVAVKDLDPAVVAVVTAAAPGIVITEAEHKPRDGRRYYDVEGRLPNGSEIEFDLLLTASGWQVVEVQRDIAWADAPAPVRAATPKGATPVRVIESKQTDGSIIYELFAAGQPKDPAIEVMWKNGQAKVLAERWPH